MSSAILTGLLLVRQAPKTLYRKGNFPVAELPRSMSVAPKINSIVSPRLVYQPMPKFPHSFYYFGV